jgi:hypothetical protein
MHQQAISKAGKSILVGNEQHCHLSYNDGINQSQKLLPFEIESPTNFTDPFIDHIPVRFTKLGQYPSLVFQVRLVRHARYSAIGNDPPSRPCFLGEDREEVFLRVVSPVRRGSVGFEHPLPIPSLQRLHGNVNSLAKFARCIHIHILHTFAHFVKS